MASVFFAIRMFLELAASGSRLSLTLQSAQERRNVPPPSAKTVRVAVQLQPARSHWSDDFDQRFHPCWLAVGCLDHLLVRVCASDGQTRTRKACNMNSGPGKASKAQHLSWKKNTPDGFASRIPKQNQSPQAMLASLAVVVKYKIKSVAIRKNHPSPHLSFQGVMWGCLGCWTSCESFWFYLRECGDVKSQCRDALLSIPQLLTPDRCPIKGTETSTHPTAHTCSEISYRITDVECIVRAKTLQLNLTGVNERSVVKTYAKEIIQLVLMQQLIHPQMTMEVQIAKTVRKIGRPICRRTSSWLGRLPWTKHCKTEVEMAGTLGWSDPVSHDCGSFVECGPTIMPHSPAEIER